MKRATLQGLARRFTIIQRISMIWWLHLGTSRVLAKVFKVLDDTLTFVIFLEK
jgi:hypothetical protein